MSSQFGNEVQEQVLETVRQSQQAVVDAVQAWAKSVEQLAPRLPAMPVVEELPTPEEVVESSFQFAERLLAAQHEFARNLLAAAAPVLQPGGGSETGTRKQPES